MTLYDAVRRLILIGFILTLMVAPFPLGANRDWSWSPLAGVVGVLLIAWSVLSYVAPSGTRGAFASFSHLRVPAILLAIVFAWVLVQLSGWTPADWASPISPSSVLGPSTATEAVSFEREPPLISLMRLLTYLAVFLLAASLPEGGSDARRILAGIVIGALLVTAYGLAAVAINRLTPYTGIVMWTAHRWGYFTGTFVNGNSYATYAGVAALAAIVLAIPPPHMSDYRESAAQRWRRRLALLSGRGGMWLAAAFVLIAGIVMAGSRAGLLSLMVAMLVVVLLYARTTASRAVFASAAIAICAAAVVLMPAGALMIGKSLRVLSEGAPGRDLLYPVTLDAIALRPMIGWGLNSFESLWPVFQPLSLPDFFDKAHNSYLELAFDLGIPAAALVFIAILWVAVRCLSGFFTRGRDRELAGLGAFATVLVAVHSLFDFSMQIPAMACTYFAVLGVAWGQSWSSRN